MDDLISRQEALDAIGIKSDEIYATKQKGATYPDDDFFQGMAYAGDIIKNLPSAQPEPDWNEIMVICDNCGHAINVKRENCKVSAQPEDIDLSSYSDKLWERAYESGKRFAELEIIRCGDCKHWKNDHLCKVLSRYGTFETEVYFYCGFAERREDETD